MRSHATILCALALLGAWSASTAQSKASLDARVTRIERMVSTGTLVDLLERVERLQRELRELRGGLEREAHAVEQLRERQRELYLDVDRRLQRLEEAGSAAADGSRTVDATGEGGEPATPDGSSSRSAESGAGSLLVQEEYQAAFDLLKESRYDEAAKALRTFLQAHRDSGYADNAQYWLGETYYVTRNFEAALVEFQRLLDEYPQSGKTTHALLKIGYIHHELGDTTRARAVLERLMETDPDSTAAQLARERLEQVPSSR